MSREQYRAQSKRVQKLGRDGLVEQDKATGQKERISRRAADVSFGPDRPQDQAAGRVSAQRTPAQGKRRKQSRPPLLPETDMPTAVDASDVQSSVSTMPTMRQADDMPATAPPPKADEVLSHKRRRQKQVNRLDPDATAHPMAEDSADDGRLQFEAERHPTRTSPAAFERQAAGAGTLVEAPPHGDTSAAADGVSAPGPTHRRQKHYEKAERRVAQSGCRLEKAQARLPAHRRARLEKEYDANTGKGRRRLRFETEVEPEEVTPPLPAQVGRTVKTAAVMEVHGKLREAERDNTALEAAHKGEFAAERGAGRFLRWNKQRRRSRPFRDVRQAQRRLHADQTRLAWESALRENPELRGKNIFSKWVQKQKIKRKYAQAAREAQKTAQHTQQLLTATGKITRAVQQYAAAHRSALLIAALLALVLVFFSAGLASCAAMLSGGQSSYLSATYLADEQDICNSELYFTELETDLRLDIADTERDFPGYDEYRYNIGEIGHSPYELMNYLSAAYGAFTFELVRPELERLFDEKYQLTRTSITETRYDDDGQPYEWTVLRTTLTVGRLGDTIAASLSPGEQTDRYSPANT